MADKESVSNQMTVIARAPFHLYYEGPAESVTAVNKIGKFDILPGHADFFSMLDPGEVVIGTNTDQVVFTIHNGIITVRDNEVMLFVNM
ncbi:MAG: atpC [Candidatus Saccharibacteria bacterium]|jgi:F0F1-type ATP synthase epsilon subunit|nr:atpC [Candidatus Saccharibacteria bacterium]